MATVPVNTSLQYTDASGRYRITPSDCYTDVSSISQASSNKIQHISGTYPNLNSTNINKIYVFDTANNNYKWPIVIDVSRVQISFAQDISLNYKQYFIVNQPYVYFDFSTNNTAVIFRDTSTNGLWAPQDITSQYSAYFSSSTYNTSLSTYNATYTRFPIQSDASYSASLFNPFGFSNSRYFYPLGATPITQSLMDRNIFPMYFDLSYNNGSYSSVYQGLTNNTITIGSDIDVSVYDPSFLSGSNKSIRFGQGNTFTINGGGRTFRTSVNTTGGTQILRPIWTPITSAAYGAIVDPILGIPAPKNWSTIDISYIVSNNRLYTNANPKIANDLTSIVGNTTQTYPNMQLFTNNSNPQPIHLDSSGMKLQVYTSSTVKNYLGGSYLSNYALPYFSIDNSNITIDLNSTSSNLVQRMDSSNGFWQSKGKYTPTFLNTRTTSGYYNIDSSFTLSFTLYNNNINNYLWPITLDISNTTVTFGDNIYFSDISYYFFVAASGITLDFNNKDVYMGPTNGLWKSSTGNSPTIRNATKNHLSSPYNLRLNNSTVNQYVWPIMLDQSSQTVSFTGDCSLNKSDNSQYFLINSSNTTIDLSYRTFRMGGNGLWKSYPESGYIPNVIDVSNAINSYFVDASFTLTQETIDNYVWPIRLSVLGQVVRFGSSVTLLDSSNHYFIIDNSNITIDCSQNLVRMGPSNGLWKNSSGTGYIPTIINSLRNSLSTPYNVTLNSSNVNKYVWPLTLDQSGQVASFSGSNIVLRDTSQYFIVDNSNISIDLSNQSFRVGGKYGLWSPSQGYSPLIKNTRSNYVYYLDSSMTISEQSDVNKYIWPLTVRNPNTIITINCDLSMTDSQYFIIDASNVRINGTGKIIQSDHNYPGIWLSNNINTFYPVNSNLSYVYDSVTRDASLNISYSTNYPIVLKQSNLQSYTWPVKVVKPNVTIQFQSDISYTSIYQYFDISASGVTIDLANKNISYYSQDSSGLWRNIANNDLFPTIVNNIGTNIINFSPGPYSSANLTFTNQKQIDSFAWPITLDASGTRIVEFYADLSLNRFNNSQYFVVNSPNTTIDLNNSTLRMGGNGLWKSYPGTNYYPSVLDVSSAKFYYVDSSFTLYQNTINNYVWPVILNVSGQVVTFGSDLTLLDSSRHFFSINNTNITIDCSNYSVRTGPSNGLWKSLPSNTYTATIINDTSASYLSRPYNLNLSQANVNNYLWPISLDEPGQKVTFTGDCSLNVFNNRQYFLINTYNTVIDISNRSLRMGNNGLWQSITGNKPIILNNMNASSRNYYNTSNISLTSANLSNYLWPIRLDNSGTVINILSDLTITNSQYFIIDSSNVSIYGNGNNVTVYSDNSHGLWMSGIGSRIPVNADNLANRNILETLQDASLNINYIKSSTISINQTNLYDYSWPVLIDISNTIIQFTSDLSYSAINQYFDISASGVQIDLSGHNIHYYSQDSNGLWRTKYNYKPDISNNTGKGNFIPGPYSNVRLTLGNQNQVDSFAWPMTLDISGTKVTFGANVNLNGFNNNQYFVIDNSNIIIDIASKVLRIGNNGIWRPYQETGYVPAIINPNYGANANYVDISFTLTQDNVNYYLWPMTLSGYGTVVTINGDISLDSRQYFVIANDNISINGVSASSNPINLYVDTFYPGLWIPQPSSNYSLTFDATNLPGIQPLNDGNFTDIGLNITYNLAGFTGSIFSGTVLNINSQDDLDNFKWPIKLQTQGTVVNFNSDIVFNDVGVYSDDSQFFVVDNSNIVFNINYRSVTVTKIYGLWQVDGTFLNPTAPLYTPTIINASSNARYKVTSPGNLTITNDNINHYIWPITLDVSNINIYFTATGTEDVPLTDSKYFIIAENGINIYGQGAEIFSDINYPGIWKATIGTNTYVPANTNQSVYSYYPNKSVSVTNYKVRGESSWPLGYAYDGSINIFYNLPYNNKIILNSTNQNSYTWPVLVDTSNTVITLTSDISFVSANQYFDISASNVTFDLGNYSAQFYSQDSSGLWKSKYYYTAGINNYGGKYTFRKGGYSNFSISFKSQGHVNSFPWPLTLDIPNTNVYFDVDVSLNGFNNNQYFNIAASNINIYLNNKNIHMGSNGLWKSINNYVPKVSQTNGNIFVDASFTFTNDNSNNYIWPIILYGYGQVVTFGSDFTFNDSSNQYFIIDNSNIIIDCSNHSVKMGSINGLWKSFSGTNYAASIIDTSSNNYITDSSNIIFSNTKKVNQYAWPIVLDQSGQIAEFTGDCSLNASNNKQYFLINSGNTIIDINNRIIHMGQNGLWESYPNTGYVPKVIDTSGAPIYYYVDASFTLTQDTINEYLWPIILDVSGLVVTFGSDLTFYDSAYHYFIIDESNITIDCSYHSVKMGPSNGLWKSYGTTNYSASIIDSCSNNYLTTPYNITLSSTKKVNQYSWPIILDQYGQTVTFTGDCSFNNNQYFLVNNSNISFTFTNNKIYHMGTYGVWKTYPGTRYAANLIVNPLYNYVDASFTLTQETVNDYAWPIILNVSGQVVTFGSDLNLLDSSSQYFVIANSNITIDCSYRSLRMSGSKGLWDNSLNAVNTSYTPSVIDICSNNFVNSNITGLRNNTVDHYLWPLTLDNSGARVTFTGDCSLNKSDNSQYFIIDNSNIVIDIGFRSLHLEDNLLWQSYKGYIPTVIDISLLAHTYLDASLIISQSNLYKYNWPITLGVSGTTVTIESDLSLSNIQFFYIDACNISINYENRATNIQVDTLYPGLWLPYPNMGFRPVNSNPIYKYDKVLDASLNLNYIINSTSKLDSTSLSQYYTTLGTYGFPISLTANSTMTIGSNISLTQQMFPSTNYSLFTIRGSNIIVDGSGYDIDINSTSFYGVVSDISGNGNNTIVKNINTKSTSTATLANGCGWVYSGVGQNTKIQHCSNSIAITGRLSGGIASNGFDASNAQPLQANIQYCFNTGSLSGCNNSGGIAGNHFNGYISYCYNKGAINPTSFYTPNSRDGSGGFCGGIVYGGNGNAIGTDNLNNINVSYCYNVGNLRDSSFNGGIIGRVNGNKVTIQNSFVSCSMNRLPPNSYKSNHAIAGIIDNSLSSLPIIRNCYIVDASLNANVPYLYSSVNDACFSNLNDVSGIIWNDDIAYSVLSRSDTSLSWFFSDGSNNPWKLFAPTNNPSISKATMRSPYNIYPPVGIDGKLIPTPYPVLSNINGINYNTKYNNNNTYFFIVGNNLDFSFNKPSAKTLSNNFNLQVSPSNSGLGSIMNGSDFKLGYTLTPTINIYLPQQIQEGTNTPGNTSSNTNTRGSTTNRSVNVYMNI